MEKCYKCGQIIGKGKHICPNIFGENNPSKRQDVKKKISNKLKGRNITWGEKISKTRKKLFIEGKIIPFWKDKKRSEEAKIKMRINNWSRRGYPNPRLGKHLSKETLNKISGPNNYGWRGGSHFEPYSYDFNRWLKEQIRQRDNFRCQLCSMEQNGHKLCIHHIDYDKKNCELDNLITLCQPCHSKTNINRNWWLLKFVNKERI